MFAFRIKLSFTSKLQDREFPKCIKLDKDFRPFNYKTSSLIKNNSMEKTEFKNKYFYWVIILIVVGLVIKTGYTTLNNNRAIGNFPVVIQILLLIAILTKHKYARIGIIIWATLFLLLFSLIQLAQGLVRNYNYGIDRSWLQYYVLIAVNVIIGALVVFYTIKTTKVVTSIANQ